jgi:PHD/YefM family antitoxin component YafN of YafNO toxin-antitoxin module
MSTITAAELKKHGVSALEPAFGEDGEAVITVRGKQRYVVMTMETYDRLRETELAEAVREARADYQAGRIADRSIKGHIKRLSDEV